MFKREWNAQRPKIRVSLHWERMWRVFTDKDRQRSQDIWPGWVQTTVQRAANTRVMTIIYPLGREERQNVKNSIMIWDPFKIRLQWLLGAGLAVFQISRGQSETVIRFKSMSFRLQVGVYKTSTVEVNGKWLS